MKNNRTPLHNLLGARVREIRLDNNLTQREMAKILGYKYNSSISNLERNEHFLPFPRFIKLCIHFNISPNEFFCWE